MYWGGFIWVGFRAPLKGMDIFENYNYILCNSFYKLLAMFVGVLVLKAILFGVSIPAPVF